jgi:hypothetical protein
MWVVTNKGATPPPRASRARHLTHTNPPATMAQLYGDPAAE